MWLAALRKQRNATNFPFHWIKLKSQLTFCRSWPNCCSQMWSPPQERGINNWEKSLSIPDKHKFYWRLRAAVVLYNRIILRVLAHLRNKRVIIESVTIESVFLLFLKSLTAATIGLSPSHCMGEPWNVEENHNYWIVSHFVRQASHGLK